MIERRAMNEEMTEAEILASLEHEPLCESEVLYHVQELFPRQRGLLRRIFRFWGNRTEYYFRVSYHDPRAGNRVVASYFVKSGRGGAVVLPSRSSSPRNR